jgi:hypothetical protein
VIHGGPGPRPSEPLSTGGVGVLDELVEGHHSAGPSQFGRVVWPTFEDRDGLRSSLEEDAGLIAGLE